jgi:RNA polymerase sigma-70 factor, ECF subfamily
MVDHIMTFPVLDGLEVRGGAERSEPMDEVRFEGFYRRVSPPLWSYIHRLTGDAAAADDILQKAFIRFLTASPAPLTDEHRRRWIFRTATNLALDHFRQTKRERGRAEAMAGRDALRYAVPRDPGQLDMMETFRQLKPRERALLWLAHVEEEAHEDIGEALGVKRGSVKVLLFRARRRLLELLASKGIGPEVKR